MALTKNSDKKWEASLAINGSGDFSTELQTAGTYVDANIIVKANVGTATLGASATGSATINSVTVGTKSGTNYPVTGSASITGTASASTTASGWATKDSTTGTGSTSGIASLSANIPAAAATVTLSGSASKPTVALDTASATKSTAKVGTITTTKPSGTYVSVKATAPATTLSATKTVDTAGYLGSNAEISASGSTTAQDGDVYYVPVTAGSLANSATASVTYAENTTVSIPSQGALYINEGYYPATMITLDQILDGKADTAGVGSDDVISGAVVYDVDGKKLTGTMKNAVVVGGDITHTLGAPTYNSTSGKFDQSCSVSTAAPSVTTAGFISSTVGTKTASAAVSENHPLNKIVATVSGSFKPSIGKATWTPATGVTNAVDTTAATTTAPTSGVYVAVASAANTGAATVSVGTAGYGTNANHGISGTVGASASDTTYIPIKTTSAAAKNAPVASATGSGVTLTASASKPSSGYYITASATAGSTTVANAGWIASGDTSTGAATDKYYTIASSTHSIAANGTATITNATLSNTQAATGTLNSTAITPVTYTDAPTNYVRIRSTAAQATAGSASIPVKCTSTAGYTAGEEKTYTASSSVGVTSATGDIYFKVYNGEVVA